MITNDNFIHADSTRAYLKELAQTPRGKVWIGIIRAYCPEDKDEIFSWADGLTTK